MKNHWDWVLYGLATGFSLFIYLYFSYYEQFPGLDQLIPYLEVAVVTLAGAFTIRLGNRYLDSKLPWTKHFILRFSVGVIGGMATLLVACFLGLVLHSLFAPGIIDFVANEMRNEWMKLIILSFFILFIFQAAYFSLYSYQQYAIVQINNYVSRRNQIRLQFEALKSQLSPHFLFNSLNTISSLVHKSPDDAEEFVRRLANIYRYVISNKQEQLVKVEEEVNFIKSYYHLLKVRFEDALKLEINLPKQVLKSSIPPLTLQILVENAVKHNKVDESNSLQIYIGAIDNTYLRISNNKSESRPEVKSFKVGLDNIRKRYAYYSEKKIQIHDRETFTVELPVINQTS